MAIAKHDGALAGACPLLQAAVRRCWASDTTATTRWLAGVKGDLHGNRAKKLGYRSRYLSLRAPSRPHPHPLLLPGQTDGVGQHYQRWLQLCSSKQRRSLVGVLQCGTKEMINAI